jgi:hypothetical protein
MAFSVQHGDKDSAATYLPSLKYELAEEKAAWEKAQAEADTLTWAIVDPKKMADKFTAQVPHLEEKVLDGLNKLRAKELALERTTTTNEDYKSQIAWLTKKLESKLSSPLSPGFCILLDILLTPLQIIESDAKLSTLKAMVEMWYRSSTPMTPLQLPEPLNFWMACLLDHRR